MDLSFIKKELLKHENVALIIAEIINPTLIGDILEHEVHKAKQLFMKDFANTEEEDLIPKLRNFANDTVKSLANDYKGLKHIYCSDKKHPELLKKFIEESLLEDGIENVAQKILVTSFELESLPELAGAYLTSKVIKNLAIAGIGDNIVKFRNEFLHGTKNKPEKPNH